jgi:hypothetical protein
MVHHHLPHGLYRLKAFPNAPIGGEYATSNGFEKPITVAAEVPPLLERQIVRTTTLSISYPYRCMLTITWKHVVAC